MTEQARLYGTVLYELKLPETMIRTCECILRENPSRRRRCFSTAEMP